MNNKEIANCGCRIACNLCKDCKKLWMEIETNPLEFLIFAVILTLVSLLLIYMEQSEQLALFFSAGLAAFFAYRRSKAMEQSIKNTEKSREDERFSRSCEMLTSGKEEAGQLAGLISMDKLARRCKDEYRKNVFDAACAFIVENGEKEKICQHAIDIFLKKKKSEGNYFYNGLTANLHGAGIDSVEFINAYLVGTDLCHSKLKNVDFKDADLSNADFRWAKIDAASVDLCGAILDNANFSHTHVNSSKLGAAKSLNGTIVPKDAYNSLVINFPNVKEGENP